MIEQMLADSIRRPALFDFRGAVAQTELDTWLKERGYVVPTDLRGLWRKTGGGEIFESETILAPFGDSSMGDDVDSVNAFHRDRGMPSDYLVFHVGIGGLSALVLSRQVYVAVSAESYEEQRRFASLADWYACSVRAEYAARYGL